MYTILYNIIWVQKKASSMDGYVLAALKEIKKKHFIIIWRVFSIYLLYTYNISSPEN